jgi:hypothetical protein
VELGIQRGQPEKFIDNEAGLVVCLGGEAGLETSEKFIFAGGGGEGLKLGWQDPDDGNREGKDGCQAGKKGGSEIG